MDENWQKENIEKEKQALKDHFEMRKRERKRDLEFPCYITTELHTGDNWDTDDSEFDDDFEKSKTNFIEKLIWDPPIEKKDN